MHGHSIEGYYAQRFAQVGGGEVSQVSSPGTRCLIRQSSPFPRIHTSRGWDLSIDDIQTAFDRV